MIENGTKNMVVPTELKVIVDEKYVVNYKKVPDCLGYEFEVYPEDGAKEVVEQVVDTMERESYDHGARWIMTSLEELEDRASEFSRVFVAKFRIRDSW